MEIFEINAELKRALEKITASQLDEIISAIRSHKRIFVYAAGRAGLMLKALAMRLMQIGCQAYVIGETITPAIENGDLLIVASASGETKSVVNAADAALCQGADILAITGSAPSTLNRRHKPLIQIQTDTKFTNSGVSVQPMSTLFEQMLLMIGDSVILKMSKQIPDAKKIMSKRHASVE